MTLAVATASTDTVRIRSVTARRAPLQSLQTFALAMMLAVARPTAFAFARTLALPDSFARDPLPLHVASTVATASAMATATVATLRSFSATVRFSPHEKAARFNTAHAKNRQIFSAMNYLLLLWSDHQCSQHPGIGAIGAAMIMPLPEIKFTCGFE